MTCWSEVSPGFFSVALRLRICNLGTQTSRISFTSDIVSVTVRPIWEKRRMMLKRAWGSGELGPYHGFAG